MNTPPVDEHEFIQGLDLDSDEREIQNGKSRHVLNGRSGTSDTNRVGVIESLRGNTGFGAIIPGETVIGSCADTRNNAVIHFIHNNTERIVTYASASVINVSLGSVSIITPSEPIYIGSRLRITQGANVFVGQVGTIIGSIYSLTTISGSLILGPAITEIKIFGENLIRRWSVQTGLFEKLTNPGLMGLVLGFQLNKKIINPRVIESSFGQMLTWTDGNVAPRLMNIDKMKEGGEYYNTANDSQYINLAKIPPHDAPLTVSLNNGTNINNLSKLFVVFKYRYFFKDGQISTFSPQSEVQYLYESKTENINAVDISVDFTVHPTVSKIQIAYRFNTSLNDESNAWYEFNVKDIGSLTGIQTFRFEQVVTAKVIPNIDANKVFDTVPQLAEQIEVVDSNQIILGAITEGYDNVSITDIIISVDKHIAAMQAWVNGNNSSASLEMLILPRENDILTVSLYSNYNIPFPDTVQTTYTIPLSATVSIAAFVSYLQSIGFTSASSSGNVITIPVSTSKIESILITSPNQFKNGFPSGLAQKLGIVYYDEFMRSGGVNVIGDLYFTDPQPTSVFSSTCSSIGFAKLTINQMAPSWAKFYKILSTDVGRNRVSHIVTPLRGAKNTLIVYGSIDFSVGDIMEWNTPKQVSGTTDTIIQAEIIAINGNEVIIDPYENNSPAIFADTQFQVVTYMKRPSDSGLFFEIGDTFDIIGGYHQGNIQNQTASVPGIISFDEYGSAMFKRHQEGVSPVIALGIHEKDSFISALVLNSTSNAPIYIGTQVDAKYSNIAVFTPGIYTAKREGVYNFKIDFQVVETNGVNILDQSMVAFAVKVNGTTVFGDDSTGGAGTNVVNGFSGNTRGYTRGVHNVITDFNLLLNDGDQLTVVVNYYSTSIITAAVWANLSVLSYNKNAPLVYSKQQDGVLWGGRVNVETPSQKRQRIGTLIRWGNALINNTQVNGLSTWDEGNYNNDLNARFGDISGLRQRGYTLSILQWSNINKAFLRRKEIQNADGSTQLVVTDNLIGTINPSEQEFGTKYPASVVVAHNNLYFFDAIKGVYCMDAGNGVIPISEAGASRFWWNTAELVKSDSRYEVISGYDFTYDDLYVTIKLTEDHLSTSIYFNANDKQWKSFVEMFGADNTPIDWYGATGQTFVTFLKGQLWKQNSLSEAGAPVYCKLFGVQRKFINEFVTNVDKRKMKVYLTHDMHVNTPVDIVKLRTQPNDMYPNGMYSELVTANYKYKEGVFYTEIKNDAYTKGLPPDDTQKRLQIATGRPVRGHCLNVRMEFFTPKYVVLMSSGVGQIISDKS